MQKVLITGASGQLGRALLDQVPSNVSVFSLDRKKLDLNDDKACKEIIKKIKPDWTINCGAYTNVDKAESEKEIALKVNCEAPKAFAEEIKNQGGKLLQISTDYVFDGINRNIPYSPNSRISPKCYYGFSKAKGEEAVYKILGEINKVIILRTSWLIGPFGNNFLLKMIDLHNKGEDINVVVDQIGSPTSTLGLANLCWKIIVLDNIDYLFKKDETKILHWSDDGIASWYDLAVAIGEIGSDIRLLKKQSNVNPVRSYEYHSKVERPFYSVLEIENTKRLLQISGIHWRKSLKIIMEKISRNRN